MAAMEIHGSDEDAVAFIEGFWILQGDFLVQLGLV